MKTRTFLAVELDKGVRRQIAGLIDLMTRQVSGIKWVESENIHLTLKFFGDVDELDIPEICQTVQETLSSHEAFSINCRGVGAFPHMARARTIWVGVNDGETEICNLQEDIDEQLRLIGFRSESRRFHPHITLGRVRDGRNRELIRELLQTYVDAQFGTLPVAVLTLFSSQLAKTGPEYNVLARFGL